MHGSEKVLQCENVGASGHEHVPLPGVPGASVPCRRLSGPEGLELWKVRQGRWNPLFPKPRIIMLQRFLLTKDAAAELHKSAVMNCTPY